MPGPMDHFLWRLERIEKDLEKVSHRFRVVFKIQFDTEAGQERPAQRSDFPFGVPCTHCEDVLNVKGYFIKSVDGLDFFRFKELSVKRADEEEYWAFPSVRELQVVTGSLGVWYHLPNAKKDEVQAICESMESTIWLFDEVLRTCSFAPEAVQVSLAHCFQMGDWAAVLLYLALRDAHPSLTLQGWSLPRPGHEDLRDEPFHPENDLVLRFMPRHVDVVTLSSYFFEVLRQITQGSLVLSDLDPDNLTNLRHGNVPLDDLVLSDAYGQDANLESKAWDQTLDADQSGGGAHMHSSVSEGSLATTDVYKRLHSEFLELWNGAPQDGNKENKQERYLDITLGDRDASRIVNGETLMTKFGGKGKPWELFRELYRAGHDGLSKHDIAKRLWPPNGVISDNNLDQHKSRANDLLVQIHIEISPDNRGVWRLAELNS